MSLIFCSCLDSIDRTFAAQNKLQWDQFVSDTLEHKNGNGVTAAYKVINESTDTPYVGYCYNWLKKKGLDPDIKPTQSTDSNTKK